MRYVMMAIVVALFATTVKAQEAKMGIGLVCDTQEQIESLYRDYKASELQTRLAVVNAQSKACAFLHIAYVGAEEVSKLPVPDGFVRILKVQVIGSLIGNMWAKIEPEDIQYIAVFEKAQGV